MLEGVLHLRWVWMMVGVSILRKSSLGHVTRISHVNILILHYHLLFSREVLNLQELDLLNLYWKASQPPRKIYMKMNASSNPVTAVLSKIPTCAVRQHLPLVNNAPRLHWLISDLQQVGASKGIASSACGPDFSCLCTDPGFLDLLQGSLSTQCSPQDQDGEPSREALHDAKAD